MEWSEEDFESCCAAFRDVNPDGGSNPTLSEIRAIMTRAVELKAARGGTMTAEELDTQLVDASARYPGAGITLREHITALGTRIAVLEAEKVGWASQLEQRAFAAEKECDALTATLEKERHAHALEKSERERLWEQRNALRVERDALKAEVQRFVDAAAHDQANVDALKTRIQDQLRAIRETRWKCAHGHPVDVAGMMDQFENTVLSSPQVQPEAINDAYELGAEAMRVACRRALIDYMLKSEFSSETRIEIQAIIDGATF